MRGLVFAVVLASCAPDGAPIRAWTFDADGGPHNAAVTLPSKLDDQLGTRDVAYTLRTEVTLAPEQRGRDLTLVFDCYHGPYLALTVGGVVVPDVGDTGVGEHRYYIPARADRTTLAVTLTARHDLREVGYGVAPRLVTGFAGPSFVATFNRYTTLGSLGVVVIVGLLYGVVYLLDRSRKEYGALAVQSAFMSSAPLMMFGLIRGPAVPFVLGEALLFGWLAALYYVRYTFGLPPPGRRWLVVFGAFMLATPAMAISLAVAGVVFTASAAFKLLFIVYMVVSLIRIARTPRHRVDAALLAVGVSIVLVSNLFMNTWMFGGADLLRGAHPTPLAILFVYGCTVAVLARQHVARQRMIDHSQQELQRQVAERSKQLADTLAKLAQQSGQPFGTGRTIDRRYRVVRRLGAGGMGSVDEVERISDGQRFALKTLHGRTDPAIQARFAQEAQIAAEMTHPNLVPVIDVGVADGELFLVMPLVDGGSLEQQRDRFGDAKWARPLLAQIAAGLVALHERGIVHRDLKPGNVLIANGVARIADFGLAALRVADVASSSDRALPETVTASLRRAPLTRAGDLFGTPMYMAPELVDGSHNAGPVTDVFAFGVIAYELLTGRRPFTESPVLARLDGRTIAAPALDAIDPVIAHCLEIDPAKRPSARDVLIALERA